MTNIAKNSAIIEWSGANGDVLLNDIVIAESVASPYIIDNLESNTEYTVKVVNRGGESDAVTFTTKEITYKEVTITLDMKDKVAGSLVENPHKMTRTAATTLFNPSRLTFEFIQSDYDKVQELDSTVFSLPNNTTNNITQIMSSFNIIEAIERYNSNYFTDKGATTLAEKVAVAKTEITAAEVAVWGYGFGGSSKFMILRAWDSANWVELGLTRAESVAELSAESNYIDNDGFIYTLINAPASDGTTASTLNIDYASLELTFLVEED